MRGNEGEMEERRMRRDDSHGIMHTHTHTHNNDCFNLTSFFSISCSSHRNRSLRQSSAVRTWTKMQELHSSPIPILSLFS